MSDFPDPLTTRESAARLCQALAELGAAVASGFRWTSLETVFRSKVDEYGSNAEWHRRRALGEDDTP